MYINVNGVVGKVMLGQPCDGTECSLYGTETMISNGLIGPLAHI